MFWKWVIVTIGFMLWFGPWGGLFTGVVLALYMFGPNPRDCNCKRH